MKGQYYLKDKKVMLVTKSTEYDELHQEIETYKYLTKSPIWAYTRQLSEQQVLSAAQYGKDETRLFVINNRKDLKLGDFIEYGGEYYTITRLDTTDDYNTDLYIYVQDAAQGDTPRDIQAAD